MIDAGQVATEMTYFLVGSRELDGGAMVTASHNPKAYTGVKLLREGALALSGDAGIQDVRAEIEARPARSARRRIRRGGRHRPGLPRAHARLRRPGRDRPAPDPGRRRQRDGRARWSARCSSSSTSRSPPPTGRPTATSPTAGRTRSSRRTAASSSSRSSEGGVDLAIAWDGDADRCFFIDGEGSFCDGDFVCALLARAALAKEPGATVLYDPRSSRAVPDTVAAAGGKSDLSRVGHAFFKIRMRETGRGLRRRGLRPLLLPRLLLRGLGHDSGAADAGAGLPGGTLALRADGRVPLQVLHLGRDQLRGRRPGRRRCSEIDERYSDGEIGRLDGVSVDYPDWHFNVRPSNTEPLLRLNLESLVSREDMEAKRDEVLGLIRS